MRRRAWHHMSGPMGSTVSTAAGTQKKAVFKGGAMDPLIDPPEERKRGKQDNI